MQKRSDKWKTKEWKTFNSSVCVENCWCAGIRTTDGRHTVIEPGEVRREVAEFIVHEHNLMLVAAGKWKPYKPKRKSKRRGRPVTFSITPPMVVR